ncbi:hypothetical protein PAXRUDRAFT_586709 [Paxillus rubicundulus Ve08.2h10]|uniref:Unplaced genomic scaffold scaffold_4782, whole genome shotgun sequence n=1 Tax=Paxillus rubicundulus Ve08.2h10 TaxID=930991 RepID=A0A0D0BPY1_9AGAM|nr:hypothetical protein PAXRUDRAFT_586709 [Paxillus rubicundulus Ve08.2h10]
MDHPASEMAHPHLKQLQLPPTYLRIFSRTRAFSSPLSHFQPRIFSHTQMFSAHPPAHFQPHPHISAVSFPKPARGRVLRFKFYYYFHYFWCVQRCEIASRELSVPDFDNTGVIRDILDYYTFVWCPQSPRKYVLPTLTFYLA